MDLVAELEALVASFHREEVDYALCGGLAVAIPGHSRATMDIDLAALEGTDGDDDDEDQG